MAIKLFCDRCGKQISSLNSVTYATMQKCNAEITSDNRLCVSCAHELRAWLSGKEENDEAAH